MYEDENVSYNDSLNFISFKNGSNNAQHVPFVGQREPYARDHSYHDERAAYEHLRPQKDIKDFREATFRQERDYPFLRQFLQDKEDIIIKKNLKMLRPLNKILRPKPPSSAFVKYPDLLIESTKWAKSDLDDLIKFFVFYLAPDDLKGDISTNFGHNIAEFHLRNSAIFIGYEQRALDSAPNVNLQPEARKNNNYNNHQAWQRNQNRPRNNYGGNQRNQGYYRQDRSQRTNFNNFPNNRGQYNGQSANKNAHMHNWCRTHRRFREGAWECDLPHTCPMAHVIAPRQQQKATSHLPRNKRV